MPARVPLVVEEAPVEEVEQQAVAQQVVDGDTILQRWVRLPQTWESILLISSTQWITVQLVSRTLSFSHSHTVDSVLYACSMMSR
jgi:hypothetical protein